MKRSRMRTWFRSVWLTSFAFIGGAFSAHFTLASTQSDSPYAVLEQMARVLVLVENEYVEPVDRERLITGAIKGMVAELDPHSSYLPAQDYALFQADTEGRFGGIGVEVDLRDDKVTVIAPIEGSPAERAGIRSGDRIVSIDGAPVSRWSNEELIRRMRGTPGTKVRIGVRRKGVERRLSFTLKREIIEVASVVGKMLEGEIAYIRLKQFQSGTHTELLEQLGKLRNSSERIRGAILDLRNNPGGLVDEATAVADEFLSNGVIYTTRHRARVVDEARARRGGSLVNGPMVVLVNEYSASAAELVAGALRDNQRATVVGAPTFGKGSVQSILDLPGNAGLRLTTMRYYAPNGDAIQARGIRPDVLVDAAYIKDKNYEVTRESDLENHLPPEGPSTGPSSSESPGPSKSTKKTTPKTTHLGVARVVPVNPTSSKDIALSVGYQIVRKVLNR